jgi:hypothetical protein
MLRLSSDTLKHIAEYVQEYSFCSVIGRHLDQPTRNYLLFNLNKNILIYGHIQSGKTKAIKTLIDYYLAAKASSGTHVIFNGIATPSIKIVLVIQNSLLVLKQYLTRFGEDNLHVITKDSTPDDIADNDVFIVLNNRRRIDHCVNAVDIGSHGTPFILMIDEADVSLASCSHLLKHALKIVYISATPYSIKIKMDKTIRLETPANYHGVLTDTLKAVALTDGDFKFMEATRRYKPETIADANAALAADPALADPDVALARAQADPAVAAPIIAAAAITSTQFITDFVQSPTRGILLVNKFHKVKKMVQFRTSIQDHYPDVPILLLTSQKVMTLGGEHRRIPSKKSLSEIIDSVAREHNHFIVIAGRLATRGMSFVSSDFRFHITHQISGLEGKSRASFLQGLRICGVYAEASPLQLYLSPKDVRRYSRLQDYVANYDSSVAATAAP